MAIITRAIDNYKLARNNPRLSAQGDTTDKSKIFTINNIKLKKFSSNNADHKNWSKFTKQILGQYSKLVFL